MQFKQKQNHNECQYKHEELDDWNSCRDEYMWNSGMWDCECNKARRINEYLDIKYFSCVKRLFGKLVLACKDEILNTNVTSLDDKKVTCEKVITLLTLFHW